MSIIEKLYYGNISPGEKQYSRQSDYGKALATVADNEEKLLKYFKSQPDLKEESQALEIFVEAQFSINMIEKRDCFIEGFKLGAKFALEMFAFPDSDSFLQGMA